MPSYIPPSDPHREVSDRWRHAGFVRADHRRGRQSSTNLGASANSILGAREPIERPCGHGARSNVHWRPSAEQTARRHPSRVRGCHVAWSLTQSRLNSADDRIQPGVRLVAGPPGAGPSSRKASRRAGTPASWSSRAERTPGSAPAMDQLQRSARHRRLEQLQFVRRLSQEFRLPSSAVRAAAPWPLRRLPARARSVNKSRPARTIDAHRGWENDRRAPDRPVNPKQGEPQRASIRRAAFQAHAPGGAW